MKVIVSACLLGKNCKYNGGNNYSEKLIDYLKDKEYVEVCPEELAGMPSPRPAVEIVKGRVTDVYGKDVDKVYREGVSLAVAMAKAADVDLAILQSRSPTCGVKEIYDGTFSKTKIRGQGLYAAALAQEGIELIDVEDL